MDDETKALIQQFVHDHIDAFHAGRLARVQNLRLKDVLSNKNPYLFKAKNLNQADTLVTALLDARLSSGEETSFGKFLEELAIFVAQQTGGGLKSTTRGIDIDLSRDNVRYLIAVKSGPHWGGAGQHEKLEQHFQTALRIARQSPRAGTVIPVEGICYGKFGHGAGKENKGYYIRLIGQSFWHLISGDENFYSDLIEALAHEAETHYQKFQAEKAATYDRLIRDFSNQFCNEQKYVEWPKLVHYISGNLPEDKEAVPQQQLLPDQP